MTKKLTHDEAREILLKGGKVDGYFTDDLPSACSPLRFDNDKLLLLDCEDEPRSLSSYAYFIEHKEPKKFEYWVNVYHDSTCEHKTREDADRYKRSDRIACIKISGKEGDGL